MMITLFWTQYYSLTHQTPATTGAFYFFNYAQAAPNGFQYLVITPASAANSEPFSHPNKFHFFYSQQNQLWPTFELY